MFRAGSRQARPGNVASNRASLSRGVAAANCDALFYLKNKSIHKTNDRGVA
jgi:hypothetical protein